MEKKPPKKNKQINKQSVGSPNQSTKTLRKTDFLLFLYSGLDQFPLSGFQRDGETMEVADGVDFESKIQQRRMRRVGLLYDERMCKHSTPDGGQHPENPDRIKVIWNKLQAAAIPQRYSTDIYAYIYMRVWRLRK